MIVTTASGAILQAPAAISRVVLLPSILQASGTVNDGFTVDGKRSNTVALTFR